MENKYVNMTKKATALFNAFDKEYDLNGWSAKAVKLYDEAHIEASKGGVN